MPLKKLNDKTDGIINLNLIKFIAFYKFRKININFEILIKK